MACGSKRFASSRAGAAEAGGGALLAAGLLTPVAASLITASMTTAIRAVHGSNGPWNEGGGWEFNAVLIAAVGALAHSGPGDLSPAALAALGAGAAASYSVSIETPVDSG